MKRLKIIVLFVTLISLFAMDSNSQQPGIKKYEDSWKKVEDFLKKNLPQSALKEVKRIYQVARQEKQEAQAIKSLVYMSTLQNDNREDNEMLSIKEIEKEITGSKGPGRAILNSLLAGMYWTYYQQHRWDLYNRTQTTDFKKEDIATWGIDDFHKKIGDLYLQSIKEENLLQQTKLAPYDAIIVKGNVRHLRPTLFDLLVYRALEYFENDERDITRPAYAFEIDQASVFDPAADFIHRRYTTRDSASLSFKALLIYQRIIAFHLKDNRPDALIDADLRRIAFANEKSVSENKDSLYFNALNHIARQYQDNPAAAQAWYLMASYYEGQADTYQPYGDTSHRYARLKAKEICERILLQKDSSEGKINCQNLLNQVNKRSLLFHLEKVNVPAQPMRALVEYRNITQLYLRIVKADDNLKKQLEDQYGEKYWPAIIAAKPLRSWQQLLPSTNDLQQHRAEIKIDGLSPGEYLLIASPDKSLSKNGLVSARYFYVSNISFVNNLNDFFVLDRQTGQPLANAAVQVWEQKYDYKVSKNIKEKTALYKTDANGFFHRQKQKTDTKQPYSNISYQLDIVHNNERLFINDLINDYYYYNTTKEPGIINSIFLFTDRSIYRPGQTVYFKGIVLNRKSSERKVGVNPDYQTTIYLRDVNFQDVDTIKVKTNEFGSFSGKFQLPQGGLNGNFSIHTKTDVAETNFKVEEYKRPKFYVDYEPLKGSYQVNDKINITGYAKAYAGNMVDGAMVKFRVVRQPRFPYPWIFGRGWFPPSAPREISHGEVTTDKDGKFVVEFTAIPDLKIEKKLQPVFDYTVYADVTDINGEVRSGEQQVSVSYKALLLKTAVPESLPVDSLRTLFVRTENMNGQFEPANVKVTVTKLNEEKRLIRERYWDRPDQFVMTKDEYIKLFPFDEFDNETDKKSWEKAGQVYEANDSVRASGELPLAGAKFAPGFYVVEITTTDKNGEEIKDLKYIELYDERNNQLAMPQYLWSEKGNPIEPGEKTTVKLGTTADNLFVVQQLNKVLDADKESAGTVYSYIKLHNEKKTFDFSASEADRGGYGVGWLFVKHNRVYQFSQTIVVPWTNKDLQIEYATYRDKTLPGSQETWKLKITGFKNELVAAEMLASMYDASLDQFYPHHWSKPAIWPSYHNPGVWNGRQNFVSVESNLKEEYYPESKQLVKIYDYLLVAAVVGRQYETVKIRGMRSVSQLEMAKGVADEGVVSLAQDAMTVPPGYLRKDKEEANQANDGESKTKNQIQQNTEGQIRKNFNETAFFFPDLKTDSNGAIEFSFIIPEALTKWKFQALAHTRDGALAYSDKEIITQKQLMVQPNPPRFLRENDQMKFSAKIVNLSATDLTGTAELQLVDANTNQPINDLFKNLEGKKSFTIKAGQSEAVAFPIAVPSRFNNSLIWRIVAKADTFSDGEEMAVPVLTNRMLVTETLSLPMKGLGTKNFSFDNLLQSGKGKTLQHYALTVEYTSNPAWYAIQALPYLMEYPYDCTEQTWNRYYANSLASMIANSSPRIKHIFEQWKTKDTALLSNLYRNEELKSVLLEETPWVLQAKNETEQKKNIALLFDMIRMSSEMNSSYEKLKQMQSSNGRFVWFKGGPDDRYMTQYIITGIGHLKKLNGYSAGQKSKLDEILAIAIPYLDKKIKEDFDKLVKSKTDLKKYIPGYIEVQYLYMRSFFPEHQIAIASKKAYDYFRHRSQLTWMNQNKYMQGMIVLALGRTGDNKTPVAVLKSLKETAIIHDELGMYWKDARRGWFWHEAPIERQALLIEAFQEIGKDNKSVDMLRTWLLKNKQTNRWESTKATAEASYALLLQGSQWLANDPNIQIKLGDHIISSTETSRETGTGYFQEKIEGKKITPDMGNISVTVAPSKDSQAGKNLESSSSWGGIYWQYFEDLDKIGSAATPLNLIKKIMVEKNTDRGPVLTPVKDGDQLKVGDKIKVRIELRVDRDMEYVHMKDMRASGMEPVNVLSSYKWQGGLGYYESTKDASTNFFFGQLRKGTYVFEYPLFITHSGNFSNGVTTIQSMYAPEFSSHSEGIRITVQ